MMQSKPESRPERSWRPILDGDLRERADRTLTEIAEALDRLAGGDDPGELAPGSLGSGAPGLAVFFAYLDRVRPGCGHAERAERLLDIAFDAAAARPLDMTLFAGFPGVAWASEHLAGDADEDANQEIDAALIELLSRSPWRGDHDLILGLAGLAVYALERLRHPSARRCLELILDRLDETAERQGGRATWKTAPWLLPQTIRQAFPDGYYNVGVAHGVPGVVAILARMSAAGIGGGRAHRLYREAAAWVLECRLDGGAGQARFPYHVGPGISAQPGRFAWCYGDPGVAAALLAAARAAGDPGLEESALEVARRAAAEPSTRRDVVDAAICHGAAGVGHLFNRIHQTTGDEAFAGAARRWFARALDMRLPGEGVAGFASWTGSERDGTRSADPGLCNGAAGIGLALLGAVSAVEPAWDRMLLASASERSSPAVTPASGALPGRS
jgi:hypothetical protein